MNRLILSVDPELDVPPYQQISTQLRAFIERGDLGPGEALPTVRQLASDLRVAPNTVARAYTDLQESGWLTSDGRRGTHVAASIPSEEVKRRTGTLRGDVAEFVAGLRRRGYADHEIRTSLEHAAARLS
ncbi:MAG TPA: GntR family transcriptional regulator [Candidatus Aquilonibacter sp.]|nr:GntR family transcriptional regulator [Candidatus Aquilonibacter sp.]